MLPPVSRPAAFKNAAWRLPDQLLATQSIGAGRTTLQPRLI